MISRREFVRDATIIGTASLIGLRTDPAEAEPPPETTRIRLHRTPGICIAPQYVAEELLRSEGFTDVEYREVETVNPYPAFAAGDLDVGVAFVAPFVVQVDAGVPVVLLGGIHPGCFELFGTARVRAIRDLRGKTVAVPSLGGGHHLFTATLATYVGLDPRKDIAWAIHPTDEAKRLLAEGKIDAYMGFPPDPQELRAKGIGHVVFSSVADRPWSQYFCCLVAGNREWVRRHPIATKRALRAIVKAGNICATDPERAARYIVDRGFTKSYDYALQTFKELPYGRWREYSAEDTVRFYALRLQEAGFIKSSPQKIIAQGTDWRFLNELKRELKG